MSRKYVSKLIQTTRLHSRVLVNTTNTFTKEMLLPATYLNHPMCENAKLFTNCKDGVRFCTDDINQGHIGDCWFLSALDFTVNHEKYRDTLGKNIYQVSEDNFGISLYDIKTQKFVTTEVDNKVLYKSGEIQGVTSKDPYELWPSLLEKGLAKLCINNELVGYPAIEGGWMSEGMCYLHGGRGYFLSSHDFVPEMIKSKTQVNIFCKWLEHLFEEGYGLFCSWEAENFKKLPGIVDMHAYSILDIKLIDGEWIFKMKNPWGHYEWKGDYSDMDQSPKSLFAHNAFDMKPEDDGVFLMPAHEFFGRCDGLDFFEPLDKNLLIRTFAD